MNPALVAALDRSLPAACRNAHKPDKVFHSISHCTISHCTTLNQAQVHCWCAFSICNIRPGMLLGGTCSSSCNNLDERHGAGAGTQCCSNARIHSLHTPAQRRRDSKALHFMCKQICGSPHMTTWLHALLQTWPLGAWTSLRVRDHALALQAQAATCPQSHLSALSCHVRGPSISSRPRSRNIKSKTMPWLKPAYEHRQLFCVRPALEQCACPGRAPRKSPAPDKTRPCNKVLQGVPGNPDGVRPARIG